MASLIWNRNSVVIVTEIRKEYETWHNKLTKRLEEVFVTGFQLFFFSPSEHSSVSFLPITLQQSWHSSLPLKTPAAIRGQQVEKRIKCLPVHQLFSASTEGKKKKDDENKTLKYFLSCLNVLYTVISCSSSVILCDRETPLQKKIK